MNKCDHCLKIYYEWLHQLKNPKLNCENLSKIWNYLRVDQSAIKGFGENWKKDNNMDCNNAFVQKVSEYMVLSAWLWCQRKGKKRLKLKSFIEDNFDTTEKNKLDFICKTNEYNNIQIKSIENNKAIVNLKKAINKPEKMKDLLFASQNLQKYNNKILPTYFQPYFDFLGYGCLKNIINVLINNILETEPITIIIFYEPEVWDTFSHNFKIEKDKINPYFGTRTFEEFLNLLIGITYDVVKFYTKRTKWNYLTKKLTIEALYFKNEQFQIQKTWPCNNVQIAQECIDVWNNFKMNINWLSSKKPKQIFNLK